MKVNIFTDGACTGNPGVGGWAAILKCPNGAREFSGREVQTTNNRMELTAVIEALKRLKYKCEVTVASDSQYVVDSINRHYKIKSNFDLWSQLKEEMKKHDVEFVWVKGHNGHPENERCDYLATYQARH